MFRPDTNRKLQAIFGLVLGICIGATRTEKLWAEMQSSLSHETGVVVSPLGHTLPERFDPARVLPSGGMASRLLAGISVKLP
jgi:hypothetical protein